MKKLLILILCVLFCLPLFSCNNTQDNPNTKNTDTKINSKYIFAVNSNTLLKYNVEDGSKSYACPDPLCTHDNDKCVFYGIQDAITVTADRVYFTKYKSFTTRSIWYYDISSEKTEKIYDEDTDIMGIYEIEGNIYFNSMFYIKDKDDEEDIKIEYSLFRYNKDSNTVDKLDDGTLDENVAFRCINNGRIIWKGNESNKCFSTDYNFKNRKDEKVDDGLKKGEWACICKTRYDNDTLLFDASRKNISTGEIETLIENATDIRMLDKGILYLPRSSKPISLGYDTATNKEVFYSKSNELHLISLTDKSDTVLCTLPIDCYIDWLFGISGSVGDYIGVRLRKYNNESDGIEYLDNILIINIVTGDYVITK
ncbi:MAG: hypothetical protein VB118_06795 [Oscillospiraceae bacterium]|nr:hypothetical protein [Oscillospiraceae bacterium]